MGILTSWWYARKIKIERVLLTMRQAREEISALLRLGVVFMTAGMMPLGAGYLVNIIMLRKFDLAAVGCYQAASVLGIQYVGFITQAMGADFYPRLTAVASDHKECNRLVNEQAEVGLLLAVPGVIATLTFAPLVIWLFYSSAFVPAVEILRWICLGMMLRVVSWPMGFILVAKGRTETLFLDRTPEQRALRIFGLGRFDGFWAERFRHRVLRIVCCLLDRHLLGRPPVERISMVAGKSATGRNVCARHRGGVCQLVFSSSDCHRHSGSRRSRC